MDVVQLIEAAKKALAVESDNQLALKLKVSRATVSNWRHQGKGPDAVTCAKLSEITGIPLARVLGIVGEARAISREEKAVWRRLASVAIVALSLLPLVTVAAPKSTTLTAVSSMHYAKRIMKDSARLTVVRISGYRRVICPGPALEVSQACRHE